MLVNQNVSMVNRAWAARISKLLNKYGITWAEFKRNPSILVERDVSFRKWIADHFNRYETFTWYGTNLSWNNLLRNHPEADRLINEEYPWWSSKRVKFDKKKQTIDEDDTTMTGNNENNILFIVIDFNIALEDTTPTKGSSSTEPQESGSTKRKLTDNRDTEEAGPSKKPTSAEETTTHTAQPLAEETTGGPTAEEGVPMQIDTPQGNTANTKGTIQGEAGSRKQQKLRGRFFGIVKVNKMNSFQRKVSNFYICFYNSSEHAELLVEVLHLTWKSVTNIINFKNDQHYVIIFELCFNIKWSTLKAKLGKGITNATHIWQKNINADMSNEDAFIEEAKTLINTLIKADIQPIDIEKEIEVEESYKRKYTEKQDEIPVKKLRTWN